MSQFPILHDHYGDAYKFVDFLDKVPKVIPDESTAHLFSLKLGTKAGMDSILSIITYVAYYGNVTFKSAFAIVGVICGSLFVLSWLLFVRHQLSNHRSQLLLVIAGIGAPFMLNFFGHQEIYPLVLLFTSVWLMLFVIYLQRKSLTLLIILIVLNILCIKLHSIAILFIPALIIGYLSHKHGSRAGFKKFLTIKGITTWILLPMILIGLFAYIFILEDYNDPRSIKGVDGIDRLFLPVISPDPPLDRYNLFSINHISDFFMQLLMLSPVALFLLVYLVSGSTRKKLNWQSIPILLIGLILSLFLLLFFAVNPLLSMPIDWDLFTLPAVPLLIFSTLLVKQIEVIEEPRLPQFLSAAIGIVIVGIPFFVLHSSPDKLSHRYEALGMRIYDTYHEWSFQTIEYALDHGEMTIDDQHIRRRLIIDRLRPSALKNVDYEFAQLLVDDGKYWLRDKNEPLRAIKDLESAAEYCEEDPLNHLYRMEANFAMKQYSSALVHAERLIGLQYKTKYDCYLICVHCAVMAKEYQKAKMYVDLIVAEKATPGMVQLQKQLITGKNLDQLEKLFINRD